MLEKIIKRKRCLKAHLTLALAEPDYGGLTAM